MHDGDYDVNGTVDAAEGDALNRWMGSNECRLTWPVHVLAPRVRPLTLNDDAAANQLNQQQQQKNAKSTSSLFTSIPKHLSDQRNDS